MSLFQIDPATFELVRQGGGFVRVSGLVEVQQGCHHRVNLIRGEARFAANKGIVHFETLDGPPALYEKGLPPGIIEGMFQDEIQAVAGVTRVEYVNLIQDDTAAQQRIARIEYAAGVSLPQLRSDVRLQENVELRTR